MQRELPKIAIVHVNTVPGEAFDEFRLATTSPEVEVQVIAVEPPGPMAGVEWLMPAVVTGFIASAYFGGFFQEMGKDHYVLLKEQLKKLYRKVAGPDAPEVRLVGTKGKVKEVQPYSLFFSLMGEVPDGLRLKLLLKRQISPDWICIVQLLMAADCRCWNIWTSLFNSSGKEGLLYGNQNHYQCYVRRNTYGSD